MKTLQLILVVDNWKKSDWYLSYYWLADAINHSERWIAGSRISYSQRVIKILRIIEEVLENVLESDMSDRNKEQSIRSILKIKGIAYEFQPSIQILEKAYYILTTDLVSNLPDYL